MEEQNLSAEKRRFHYYELLHEVFHYVMQAELSQKLASEILNLDCEERNAFQMQMETVFYGIEKEMMRPYREENSIENIVVYLQEHFTDPDLTLSAVANHFHLSMHYLSGCFKERVGCSYIQYVSKLRMEKARQLLRETELSVQEITERVGYVDGVSFSRKFKKVFLISPSEYRKLSKEETEK